MMRFAVLLTLTIYKVTSFTPLISLTSQSVWKSSISASKEDAAIEAPAPVLDGKRVLPYKIMAAGIKGHRVAAVYAVLGSKFKRGSDGWDSTEYVGVTQDLGETLGLHVAKRPERVAHVRAVSFADPQPNAMQDLASEWKKLAKDAGTDIESELWEVDVMEFLFDEDDDDDDDDIDMADVTQAPTSGVVTDESEEEISYEFSEDGVDKVLDEVRPYLIADGGNISVERVDPDAWTVTLKLEGACGSCSSSTVTMQMGVERVLREKFPELKEVLQVEQDPEAQPTALDFAAVKEEVGRLSPAIMAMGGSVELMSVDPEIGLVKLKFVGTSKVQQGIELAILDVPFVEKVEFV